MAEEEAQVGTEEEEVTEEEETGEQGGEPEAEVEEIADPPAPKPLTDEIKVVIVMKADNILLGVQNPVCDPVYTTMKGSLDEALEKVPGLVAEAKQKWEAAPRYPKANLPEAAPSPVSTRTSAVSKSTAPKAQPSMF